MADTFTIIFLGYTFLSLYFLILFILTYLQNRKEFYETFKPDKEYTVSFVVPCYNAENQIRETVENLLKSDYPGLKRIVVVDDCSKDNTWKIIQELDKKYEKVMAVQTPKNTGNAAGAKNYGSKFVETELIGFTDDDSYPKPDAISKMVGFFNDPKVGAVTSQVLVRNRNNFLSKIQAIEYKIIAFTRKLFGFIESIYVTNGPLSIYRKKAFDEVDGFDDKNLTEDIEFTWHIVTKGYKVHMSVMSKSYTIVPEKLGEWFRQRIRWNVGGMQTVAKYKRYFFKKGAGMLGIFIMPAFVMFWFLGLTGLSIFIYRAISTIVTTYFSTLYTIQAEASTFFLEEINLSPTIIFLFGTFMFLLSFSFTLLSLFHLREKEYKRHGILDLVIYMIFYVLVYPILLITSFYKFLRGKKTW